MCSLGLAAGVLSSVSAKLFFIVVRLQLQLLFQFPDLITRDFKLSLGGFEHILCLRKFPLSLPLQATLVLILRLNTSNQSFFLLTQVRQLLRCTRIDEKEFFFKNADPLFEIKNELFLLFDDSWIVVFNQLFELLDL